LTTSFDCEQAVTYPLIIQQGCSVLVLYRSVCVSFFILYSFPLSANQEFETVFQKPKATNSTHRKLIREKEKRERIFLFPPPIDAYSFCF
jgi:hypothetical protein